MVWRITIYGLIIVCSATGGVGQSSNLRGRGDNLREGSYRMFGVRANSLDPRNGVYDSWNGREVGRESCPYDNPDRRNSRRKRKSDISENLDRPFNRRKRSTNESLIDLRNPVVALYSSNRYADRYPFTRYDSNGYPSNRYPDTRYPDSRYPDSRYPYSRYPDSRYPDSRYPDSRYPDSRYPDSRYPNRRPSFREGCDATCLWEAEISCPLKKRTGNSARYPWSGDSVRWERENDAHYPRAKYRDIKEYFGNRARIIERDGLPSIQIFRVRPEDKGVYRCYLEGGGERDFMEVKFYPKYPADSKSGC